MLRHKPAHHTDTKNFGIKPYYSFLCEMLSITVQQASIVILGKLFLSCVCVSETLPVFVVNSITVSVHSVLGSRGSLLSIQLSSSSTNSSY